MGDFFEDFIPYLTASVVAFALGFLLTTIQHFFENERIFKCLKNDKCLEYIKKYEEAPSEELLKYLTINGDKKDVDE